jgi:acyl carrier protein
MVRLLLGPDKAERVGVNSRLLDDGGIDSFGLVSLVAELESTFMIAIANEDLIAQNFRSVCDIAVLVDRYQSAVAEDA